MKRFGLSAIMALIGAGAGLAVGPVMADGRLEARYKLSLGGLELGRAAFLIEVDEAGYTASGSARLTGMVQAISSGRGAAGARGAIERGALVPRSFAMEAETDRKSEAIKLTMSGAAVTDMTVEPPVDQAPDRIPVTDKDKRNTLDPMSAILVMVPGTDAPVSAKACERVLSIFDGRQRYDIELSFERMEDVKAERGYSGPSVVCRVAYRPVSGHRPSRKGVKYMMNNKEMYVWLAPVAGTRMLVPFRASVTTLLGVAEFEAQSFVTEPMVGRKATPAKAGVQ